MKPPHKKLMVLVAVAAVLLLPLAANADIIPVGLDDFIGSRSTANTPSGLVTADGWTSPNGGFKVAWNITQTPDLIYHYSYTFTNESGGGLVKAISHLILEVSPTFTLENLISTNAPTVPRDDPYVVGPKLFTSTSDGGSNPNMPTGGFLGGIYGIKLDWGPDGGDVITYTLDSDRAPVWGDFYTKDGKDDGIWATAWNAGFDSDPTLLTIDFTNWVPTPDTFGIPVPLPPTALLLGSGLLGLGLIGWRRREKKA